MADRRSQRPTEEQEYTDRLFQVGVLWQGQSRRSGRPILTGEMSLGLFGPRDILITENAFSDRSENAPSHVIYIRVPRRGTGNGQADQGQSSDDLDF